MAGKVLECAAHAPSRVRKLAGDLDQADAKLRFLRRYTDLYRPYTQAELVYDDTNTAALHASLDPADQTAFGFDPAGYDWDGYLRRHCDSVTGSMRAMSGVRAGAGRRGCAASSPAARRSSRSSTSTARWCPAPSSSPTCGCACRERTAQPACRASWPSLARHAPGWMRAERSDRGRLIREVYTRYAGADPEQLARLVDDEVGDQLLVAREQRGPSPVACSPRRRPPHGAAHRRRRPCWSGRCCRCSTRWSPPSWPWATTASAPGRLASPPLVGEARAAWLRFTAPRIEATPAHLLRLRRQPVRPADAADRRAARAPSTRICLSAATPRATAGRSCHWDMTAGEHRLALTR